MTDNTLINKTMTIVKASFDKSSGVGKFRMVCSDTGPDVFDERMSIQLFNDFTSRIENNLEVPVQFRSVLKEKSGWSGGLPYVSIAHYPSGKDGLNIPADTEKVYTDGEMLKATAVCRNTPLGNAVFKALKADLDGTSEYEDKIRVSIGFLDLQHSHGDFVFTRDTLDKSCPMCKNNVGNKVYLKGQLVHLALTRVPANPRTDTEVDMSEIKTKKDDAESIVGKTLAEEIEVNKTSVEADDLLVVKADMMGDNEKHPMDCTCKACASKKKAETEKAKVKDSAEEDAAEGPETGKPDAEDAAEGEDPNGKKKVAKTSLDLALEKFKDQVISKKSMTREQALVALQPEFELLAKSIQDEFAPAPVTTQVVASIDPALNDLIMGMKTALDNINSQLGSLNNEITILKSQNVVTSVAKPTTSVPAPRGIQVERNSMPDIMGIQGQKPLSIKELALRSVQS